MVQTSEERGKLACYNIYSVITHIQCSKDNQLYLSSNVSRHKFSKDFFFGSFFWKVKPVQRRFN